MTTMPRSGLLASLRRLLASALALAQTRLELLLTELEEERLHLLSLAAYGIAAVFLLGLGLLFLLIFLTVLFWDSHRLLVLGGFTALFLIAGGIAASLAMRHAHRKKRPFAATMAELGRDRAALESPPPPGEA